MNVLLIKMSSMGDILHALPAITDATRFCPELTFDWIIEENFSDIAGWHPAINHIIPSAHRRWRKHLFSTFKNREFSQFCKAVRLKTYDKILDAQTNHKSALLSLIAKGLRVGLDKYSVREYIAHFAYQKAYHVSRKQHAIEIIRSFFAKAFGYEKPTTFPDFGIDETRFQNPELDLPKTYYFFVHQASWKTKLWPEAHFRQLIQKMDAPVLLSWGNEKERKRAEQIAAGSESTIVLPSLNLSEIAYLLKRAKGTVTVDTGLGHLASLLKVPTVSLYGPTNPALVGTVGKRNQSITSHAFCPPCQKGKCLLKTHPGLFPPCLAKITPEEVHQKLMQGIHAAHTA